METRSGSCLCGAVRFEVDLPTLFCAHCHCTMCQRANGAGYVTWFGIPYERFRVTAGSDRLVRYASSDHGTRSFCGTCGSQLFCESTRHPDWIDVTRASVAGALDREPEMHVFFDDRAAWIRPGDELLRLGGKTGIEPTG